ncbi:Uncharacterised protein [uncultured archaeon]|nr:Uncharacterised protein [uncultured archaeon]
MKRDEVLFLNQLIKSLEDAEKRLEISYKRKEYENFNQSKKIMLRMQEEISEIIK